MNLVGSVAPNKKLHIILTLIVILELYIFLFIFPWHITLFFVFIYSLWYFDKTEHNGTRNWPWFRKFVSSHYYPMNKLAIHSAHKCALYVVMEEEEEETNCAIMCAISDPHCFLMESDWNPMWIPIVRDILLWCGMVCIPNNSTQEDFIFEMLSNSRSIVCTYFTLSNQALKIMIDEKLIIIPVRVYNGGVVDFHYPMNCNIYGEVQILKESMLNCVK